MIKTVKPNQPTTEQEVYKAEHKTVEQLEELASLYTFLASWEPSQYNQMLHQKVNDLIWHIKTYGQKG